MADAVILAGGRSTRFGEADKALAELAGRPMLRRVADRLVSVSDRLVINCRADQTTMIADACENYPNSVVFAEDPEPDKGPMAGMGTALRAAESEYAFVAACDMPFIEPALVAHQFERATGYDAAVPRTGDGWLQTTHAVYCAEAMAEACERALAAGERKAIAPLDYLDCVILDENELREHATLDTFENLNTREEFEEAAQQIE